MNKSASRGVALFLTLGIVFSNVPIAFAADTGFDAPNQTVSSNSVSSPNNAWVSDNNKANFNDSTDVAEYGFPDLGIPAGSTIDGIEVSVEGRKTVNRNFVTALWNASNGNAYTTNKTAVVSTSPTDTTVVVGSPTDKWGKTWTVADFADATFKIRVSTVSAFGDAQLDHVQVKVYFTAPDTSAPVLAQVTPVPATTNDDTPNYTFSSTEAGTITYGGDCSSATTAAVVGNNTVTFNTLSSGAHNNCTITVTDSATPTPNASSPLAVSPFTINTDVFDKGMVTLSFDDGAHSIYQNARPIMNTVNFDSTQYIITGATGCADINNPECDFMTTLELNTMEAEGHEIANHTRTDPDGGLVGLSASNLLFEIDGLRLDLLQNVGLPAQTFAYPFGLFDDALTSKLKSAGIVGARTVNLIGGGGELLLNNKNTDRYHLFAGQVNGDTPITSTDPAIEYPPGTPRPEWGYVESWIDQAIATNQWLVLVFHEVSDTCTDNFCITPARFQTIVTYLQSKGSTVDVVTMKEGLSRMNNHPTSGAIAPVITQGDINAAATSIAGAEVPFSPVVSDSDANVHALALGNLSTLCTIPTLKYPLDTGHPIWGVNYPTNITSPHTFGIGTTTVNCTAADVGGNLASSTFNVIVTDGVPVIASTTNMVVEATSASSTVVTYDTPAVTDAVSNLTATCAPASGSMFPIGVNPVTCNAGPDASGQHAATTTFTITVQDTTAPVITLNGDAEMTIEVGTTYTEPGASSTDVVDGEVPVVITGTVDGTIIGDYVLTYTSTDSHSNVSVVYRTVHVRDLTAPVITVLSQPSAFINLTSATTTFSVNDVTASTTCKLDGGSFEDCSSPKEVSGLSEGPHTLTIQATDPSNNSTSTIINFTVDTEAPTVAINGQITNDTTPTITGTASMDSASVSVTVNSVTYIASTTVGTWSVNVTDTLSDGTYAVTAIATDAAGNTSPEASGEITINTQVPNVTVNTPAPNTTSITGTASAGSASSSPITIEVAVNGHTYIATSTTEGSQDWIAEIIDALPEGLHEVQVRVTDALSNQAVQTVNLLIDHTAPVIVLTGDATITVALNGTYIELGATATDNIDTDVPVTPDASAVNMNAVGSYQVNYNATDDAGNAASTTSRTVNVTDQTKPVITLLGASPANLAVGQAFTDAGATALDNVDGDITANIIVTGSVDSNTIGTYELRYNVSDSNTNTALEVVRTVVVSDLMISSEASANAETTSVTVTWTTSHPATSRVIYDITSHNPITEPAPNYGYASSTVEDSNMVTSHSVTVSGLTEGTAYFFRPISHGSPEVVGNEVSGTTTTTPPPSSSSSGGGGGGSSRPAGDYGPTGSGSVTTVSEDNTGAPVLVTTFVAPTSNETILAVETGNETTENIPEVTVTLEPEEEETATSSLAAAGAAGEFSNWWWLILLLIVLGALGYWYWNKKNNAGKNIVKPIK